MAIVLLLFTFSITNEPIANGFSIIVTIHKAPDYRQIRTDRDQTGGIRENPRISPRASQSRSTGRDQTDTRQSTLMVARAESGPDPSHSLS